MTLLALRPCVAEPRALPLAPATLQRQAFLTPGGPRYAYISDLYGNFVDQFDRAGRLVAKITTGITSPGGMYVDPLHNLWVATPNGAMMFREGATVPSRTLQGAAGDVTIGLDGTAYVTNGTSILVYPPHHDKPARQLQDPRVQPIFITTDSKGDVFVTVQTLHLGEFVGRVEEYIGGRQSGLRLFRIKLGQPGGIRWRNGRLYVCDTNEHTVTEYTETGRATGRRLVTGGAWAGIDFSPDGTTILGADQTYIQGISRQFPMGKIRRTYVDPSFQLPAGAAFQTDMEGS